MHENDALLYGILFRNAFTFLKKIQETIGIKIDLNDSMNDVYHIPMPIISVEGNIGSGKSTILRALRACYPDIQGKPVVYLDEPVSQWEQIKSADGKNMIELFYANPSKYAFAFQMMAYISRLSLFKEAIRAHPNSIIITERCLLTDYHIFASMLYEQGSMLDEEFAIYKQCIPARHSDYGHYLHSL